jgi:hypothetical protein
MDANTIQILMVESWQGRHFIVECTLLMDMRSVDVHSTAFYYVELWGGLGSWVLAAAQIVYPAFASLRVPTIFFCFECWIHLATIVTIRFGSSCLDSFRWQFGLLFSVDIGLLLNMCLLVGPFYVTNHGSNMGQINELSDIARCIASTSAGDEKAPEYIMSCMEDLKDVLRANKVQALTVDTFGNRIEKLCRYVLNLPLSGSLLSISPVSQFLQVL